MNCGLPTAISLPSQRVVFTLSGNVPVGFNAELVVKGEVAEMRNYMFSVMTRRYKLRHQTRDLTTVGTHSFLDYSSCIQIVASPHDHLIHNIHV